MTTAVINGEHYTEVSMPHAVFSSLDSYLGEFAGAMADRVGVGLAPLFDPERDSLSPEVKSLTDCAMVPYPAQAVGVEAMVRNFGQNNSGWIVGECGSGKTPMGLWTVRVMEQKLGRPMRIIITAPNQLAKKWRKHCQIVLPGCRAVIIKNWKDLNDLVSRSTEFEKVIAGNGEPMKQRVKRWRDPECTEVWILPRDRGKLGYAWTTGVSHSQGLIKYERDDGEEVSIPVTKFRCPKCGRPILNLAGKDAGMDYFVNKRGKLTKKQRCDHCGEPLWQAYSGANGLREFLKREAAVQHRRYRTLPVNGKRQVHRGDRSPACYPKMPVPKVSPRRMAPCQYLRRLGFKFDMYIADEAHELKGQGSLQGQMFADLCLLSTYRLMLTGTLVGGYANNLLHLLWRTIPFRLVEEGLAHNQKGFGEYVELYGVLQTIKRYVAADRWQSQTDLVMGRGKQVSNRTKVLPGISPVLFVNYMLDQAVFLRLQEMSAHLPRFSEKVHAVPHTAAQDKAMHAMQIAFEAHRKRTRPCRAWSAARHVFLRWPDKPWVDEFDVMDRDEDDRPIFAFHVPSLPRQEYPKERRVRRIVQRNIARGRRTWIFTELSGRERAPFWDHMDYLASYLEGHGIRVAVLRSNGDGGPKPEDREEWIERIGPTVDVVISNPALVQTGLDLYDFPSICFAFCGDNTYRLRQASRRAYRLGQKQTCEVDYVVYAGQQTCDKQALMDGDVITGWTRVSQAKHVQDAAMSLMSKKMQASLAIEGDFGAEGLAALSDTDDMASQLAKFIDGRLSSLDPAKTAFEKYRVKLEACMPELAAVRPPAPAEGEIVAPPQDETPAPAMPEIAPPAVSREDDVNRQAAFDLLASLGIEVVSPPEPEPVRTEAEQMFAQPALARSEPSSIKERKALRLKALCQAMGCEPSESAGDRHRFGPFWYQLVAKRRGTVRERNFTAIAAECDDSMIAFVEPVDEAGPTVSPERQRVGGVEYVVSTMFVSAYLAGERIPGGIAKPS